MNRPIFMFRPNLRNEDHRRAWAILQAVPEGQKSTFLMEITLRRVLREELKAVPSRPAVQQEETIPEQMMGFLGSLMGEEYPQT